MAEIKDTVVKKQVQQQSTSATTKPKVETKNKDIAVFGKLSTANKTTEKASSETLANRLSGAQGEKPQAEAKEVKRDDAQVSVSAFGSLTGIKQEKTQAKDNASIFNRLDSAQSAQGVTNPVNASDVASTKEALAQEKGSTGSKFDSDNFAAFNDDAPNAENCGSNNQAMIQKRRVDQYGGYLPGQVPGYTNVTKPNVHRNNVIDVVNRYNTGTTRSQFQRQIEYDYRDAMGLELGVGGGYGGYGSGCGCSGTGAADSGCSGTTSSSSSKHHKKHKGISTGAAIAIGLGAGLGGLALGGLAAWGISKAASSGAEAAKGGAGTTNNIASVGGSVGSVASAAGNSVKSAAQLSKEATQSQHNFDIPENHDISGTLRDNKSVISDLKSAKENGRVNEALQAGETQYAADSQAIETVNGDISSTGTALSQNQANQESYEEIGDTASDASKTLDASITEDSARKDQCMKVHQQYTAKADEYGESAKKAGQEADKIQEDITSLEDEIKAKKAQVNKSGGDTKALQDLNSEISKLEAKLEAKKQEKTKKDQEKANFESMQEDAKTQAAEAKTTADNLNEKITENGQEKTRYDALKDNMQTRVAECASRKSTLSEAEGLLKTKLSEAQTNKENLVTARNELLQEMNNTYRDSGGAGGFLGFGRDNYSMKTNAFKTIDSPKTEIEVSSGTHHLLASTSANSDIRAKEAAEYARLTTPENATPEAAKPVASGSVESDPKTESTPNNPTPTNDEIKSADGKTKLEWVGEGLMNSETGEYFTGEANDNKHYTRGLPTTGEGENGKFYNEGTPVNKTTIECNGEKVYCIDGFPTCGTDKDGVHYDTDGRQMSMMQSEDGFVDDSGKLANGFYNGTLYKDGQDDTQNTLGYMNYIIENLGEGETTTYASIASDAGLGNMQNIDAFIEANRGNLLELPKPKTTTD